MLYLIVLLITLFCLALSLRVLEKGQLCSPAVLFLSGMAIATLLAIVGRGSWNNIELKLDGALVLVIGTLSYTVGCLFAHRYARFTMRVKCNRWLEKSELTASETSKIKYLILLLIVIVAIVIRINETLHIAETLGLNLEEGYFTLSELVRSNTTAIVLDTGRDQAISFSFFINQVDKVVAATGFASAVILAKRLNDGSEKRNALLPSSVLIVSSIYYLVSNSRSGIIWFVASFVVAFYIFSRMRGAIKISPGKVLLISVAVLLGVALFYVFGMLFGRGAGSGILDYITFYYGSEIPSLQALLDNLPSQSMIIGGYTFNALYTVISKLIPFGGIPSYSIEWIDFGGLQSNVFSCFSRYYLDFGYIGIVVLAFVLGLLLTGLYERTLKMPGSISMLVYCSLSPYIFDMVREEYFYSRFISTTQIITLVLTIVIYVFLISDLKEIGKQLAVVISWRRSDDK